MEVCSKIYAVYDTTGIQSYVFASGKLRENVGASVLVGRVLKCYLPEALEKELGKENVVVDWRSEERRSKALEDDKAAEIIYVGGGNAYVAFKDIDAYRRATRKFLLMVYDSAPGIGIASAYIESNFEDGYEKEHKKLMKRLSEAKGRINRPMSAGSQPITRSSLLTGQPVTRIDNVSNEPISEEQYHKRLARNSAPDGNKFEDFDSLTRGNNNFLAVVHVDGNRMGKYIEEYFARNDDSPEDDNWSNIVPKIRKMSYRISKLYETAYREARKDFCNFYRETDFCKDEPDKELPLIRLIGDGDDITCVLTGRWGISFAVKLLQKIETYNNDGNELYPFETWCKIKAWQGRPKPPRISACAGVVIFHSHYPFSAAYKMAEECCRNAKSFTRNTEATKGAVGSFIDFHLHQSGAIVELKSFRDAHYSSIIGGKTGKSLMRRPFCVTDECVFISNYPMFNDLEDLTLNWAKGRDETKRDDVKLWPRSRLKALLAAISAHDSENSVEEVLKWCEARGYELPVKFDFRKYEPKLLPGEEDAKREVPHKFSWLLDTLDMADIYEKINDAEAV